MSFGAVAVVVERVGLVAVQFLVSASEASMVEGKAIGAHAMLGQSPITQACWRLTRSPTISPSGDERDCWLALD